MNNKGMTEIVITLTADNNERRAFIIERYSIANGYAYKLSDGSELHIDTRTNREKPGGSHLSLFIDGDDTEYAVHKYYTNSDVKSISTIQIYRAASKLVERYEAPYTPEHDCPSQDDWYLMRQLKLALEGDKNARRDFFLYCYGESFFTDDFVY